VNDEVLLPETLLGLFRERLGTLYGEREILQMFRMLLQHTQGWGPAELHMNMRRPVEEGRAFLLDALEQLTRGRPVQYIIGVTGFRDLELKITEAALIPRPETEELADLVIRENRQREYQRFSVLDIGTGSGCIALALKNTFRHAEIDAIDHSRAALDLAAENALRLGLHIRLFQADILDPADTRRLPGYDLIVSNPPYVTESEKKSMRPNVLAYEPPEALFVPDDDPLRYYRAIGKFALRHLVRPGAVYLEINERFGSETVRLMTSLGFEKVGVHRDLHGKDRFVACEAKTAMRDISYWMVDKDLPEPT
jgi:release factor glutamine methyltransferase